MSDWKNLKLEQIADIIDPHPSHRAPAIDDRGIPFIGIGDIDENGNLIKNARKVSSTIFDDHQLRYKLNKNTIGFGRVATIGKIIRFKDYSFKFTVSPTMAIIQPKNVESTFLAKSLESLFVKEQIDRLLTGSTRSSLGIELLRDLIIPIPTRKTQVKIANILISTDILIGKTKSAIAKYNAIKQGMLHDLFTRGIDIRTGKLRPGYEDAPDLYKESELGIVPKDWDIEESNKLVRFINGRAYGLHEWELAGTPVIRLQNLTGSGLNYYYSNLKLPDDQYCNKGDLLYMWSATFGPHVWKGDKAIFHYHIWKVECSNKISQDYFYYNLLIFTQTVLGGSNGSTMAHITKEGMDKRLITVPPIDEQRLIANRIAQMDYEIESEESYLLKLQQIRTGLMNDLLTGKKKISVTE